MIKPTDDQQLEPEQELILVGKHLAELLDAIEADADRGRAHCSAIYRETEHQVIARRQTKQFHLHGAAVSAGVLHVARRAIHELQARAAAAGGQDGGPL